MVKIKKKTALIFAASFAGTVLLSCLLIFVLFKSIFYNVYMSRGNKLMEQAKYSDAAKCYETAKGWRAKRQEAYLKLSQAYEKAGDYEKAGSAIDQAIEKKVTTSENGLEQLYIMRIKIYSSGGDLTGAVKYTDGISDQYILRKIQEIRPADLSYTPTQGDYDKTQKMKITVRDGETVYYTTDGTYPSKSSSIYVDPINIGNGRTSITAVSVNADGMVSPLLSVTYNITNDNEAVSFDDPKIEKMVRSALNKPNGVIRVKELASVTVLSNADIDGKVKTLSDLDMMPELESLSLDGENALISISQLSGKSKLRVLALSGCNIDSTEINVLGSLTALETLDLSDNRITSVSSLSGLTSLKNVYLAQNSIEDLSALSASKALVCLDASQNRITAIPDFDSNCPLETLILSSNQISDISTVHRFTSLKYLDVSFNRITNAKNLSALTKLETLSLSGNNIANFNFLSSLKALTSLSVDDTSFVSAKPLSGLKLVSFSASGTGLASLNELSGSTELRFLAISETNVTDLSPIKNAGKLDYIDISYCDIADLSVLTQLQSLSTLKATGINLSNVEFKNPDLAIVS